MRRPWSTGGGGGVVAPKTNKNIFFLLYMDRNKVYILCTVTRKQVKVGNGIDIKAGVARRSRKKI
jgi:hypothetical protein